MKKVLTLLLAVAALVARAETPQDEFKRKEDASIQQALRIYPDSAKEGSALYAEIQKEIEARTKSNDPIFQSPDWPMAIAGIVAGRMAPKPSGVSISGESSPVVTRKRIEIPHFPLGQLTRPDDRWAHAVFTDSFEAPVGDGTQNTITFEAGDVVPISRVMKSDELPGEWRGVLPSSECYAVIPFVNRACVVPSSVCAGVPSSAYTTDHRASFEAIESNYRDHRAKSGQEWANAKESQTGEKPRRGYEAAWIQAERRRNMTDAEYQIDVGLASQAPRAPTQYNGRPLPRNWIDPKQADQNFLMQQQNQQLDRLNRNLERR